MFSVLVDHWLGGVVESVGWEQRWCCRFDCLDERVPLLSPVDWVVVRLSGETGGNSIEIFGALTELTDEPLRMSLEVPLAVEHLIQPRLSALDERSTLQQFVSFGCSRTAVLFGCTEFTSPVCFHSESRFASRVSSNPSTVSRRPFLSQ